MTQVDLLNTITSVITQLTCQGILVFLTACLRVLVDPIRLSINSPFLFGENASILYTLHTPEGTKQFDKLEGSNLVFDSQLPMKILLHDYNTTDGIKWFDYMTKEYLKSGKYNVITANYEEMYKKIDQVDAFSRRSLLGTAIAELIEVLGKNYGVKLDNIHLLGHGLGAHIAGSAGERIYKKTGELIGRITGLDPSSTGIMDGWETDRLSPLDAKLVDVIHSSYGTHYSALGRVDFRADHYAFKCDYEEYSQLKDGAAQLYAKSINGPGIEMVKCIDGQFWRADCESVKETMGENVQPKAFGEYYPGNEELGDAICKMLNIKASNIVMPIHPLGAA